MHADALDQQMYSLLIALQPETSILYEENSLDSSPNVKTVAMTTGDVLLFGGNFVHAGAAYEETNIRLHTYLRDPGSKQPYSNDVTLYYNDNE